MKTKLKICPVCKKEFQAKMSGIFGQINCSQKCARIAQRPNSLTFGKKKSKI